MRRVKQGQRKYKMGEVKGRSRDRNSEGKKECPFSSLPFPQLLSFAQTVKPTFLNCSDF